MPRNLFGLPESDAATLRTRVALNQPDLYPVLPAAPVAAAPATGQGGLSTRPLTAQEALLQGDPKLLAALRKRGLAAAAQPEQTQPAVTPQGFGAKRPPQPY